MKMTPLQIYGGSYADNDLSWSAQDVLGYLPSQAETPGTKTPGMFKTPPGLRPFAEIEPGGGARPVRGSHNAEGKMFVVIGTTLFQLSNAGVYIPLGTIPGTGRVIFSHNQVSLGNQILAVNGSAGYIYDTRNGVFQRITDPGYPGAFVSTFIDGYFVQISTNRRFAFNSDVANGLEYNTLDRFTSEFSPDLLVSLVASNNELFLLSETSGEFFENTGAAQQPFRSKRITMDRGCAGAYTVAKADNTVFWLGNNGYFYVLNGYAPQRISTRAIEQSILGKNWKQAFAFAWEDAGHTVIYWTFPDGLTWGYDTSTGLWHRRESYGLNRWRVNTMTFWNQEWYAGDFQYGRVWKMDWDYILEGDQEFPSERTTAVIHDNQNRIIIPRLELLMQVGQEETVAEDFPVQPEGPEITPPPLPDGIVGFSWAGGTYTATGGTPPYTFTSRPGTTWPGNLGPMNIAGVVASEVPTNAGAGVNIARVTDANGLFAEITDPFEITTTPGVMMAQQRDNNTIYSVDGGLNFVLTVNDPQAGNRDIKAVTPARFIANLRYTDDFGATAWQVATATETKNYHLTQRGTTVIVGANGPFEPVSVSVNSGVTSTSGGATSNGMYSPVYILTSGPLLAVGKGTDFMSSIDDGATFATTGVAHGFLDNNTSHASCKFSGGAVYAGSNTAVTAVRVVFTADGLTYTGGDITGLGSTSTGVGKEPSHICVGEVAGVETAVVLGDAVAGELFWTDDEGATFHLVSAPLGLGFVLDAISWNGVRFVLGGRNGSTGALKYSTDLVTWTDCTAPSGSQGYYAIDSLPAP